MNIVWWLLVGLVAGFLARAIVPGRDRMGWAPTLMLGLVGSLVGGVLGNLFSERVDFSPSGMVGSVIGSIVALLIYRATFAKRSVQT